MGTRGVWGFTNGEAKQDKVEYVQYDMYPDGVGLDIKHYIQEKTPEELQALADSILVVSDETVPTGPQIAECQKAGLFNRNVGEHSVNDWYCLLRQGQGDFASREKVPYMLDARWFVSDGLGCEWGYIWNTQTEKLEVYSGGHKQAGLPGRYADTQKVLEGRDFKEYGYRGIVLLKEYSIEELKALSDEDFEKEVREADESMG